MNGRPPIRRQRYRFRIVGLRQPVVLLRYPVLADAERRAPIHFTGWEKARRFFLTVTTTDATHGLATLFDGQVLMVLATLLTERLNNGEPLDSSIEITLADMLERLGRHDDGRQRDLLLGEIGRLHATCVHTDLGGGSQSFRLIEEVVQTEADKEPALLFTLPTFLIDEIAAKRILDVDPVALALSSLELRVYGWARACVGLDPAKIWRFDLERAHALAACESSPQDFARAVRDLVRADRLPGYTLSRVRHHDRPNLLITARPTPVSPVDSSTVTDTTAATIEVVVM